jgi:O-antigen ligase
MGPGGGGGLRSIRHIAIHPADGLQTTPLRRPVFSLAQTALLDRAAPQVRSQAAVAPSARTALAAVALLVVCLPFERALFSVSGVTVTTLEAVAGLALVTCFWAARRHRHSVHWPEPALPGLVFVLVLTIAALAAPAHTANALRFAARMAMAGMVAVAVASLVSRVEQVRLLVRVFVAVAALVSVVAVLEAWQVPFVMNALTAFRPGFHVVAGELRATATMIYPTITSMFLEVAFATGLWLVVDPAPHGRRERPLAMAALATIGAGIAATFTRAGLLGMAAAIVLLAAVVWRRGGSRTQLGALAAVAVSVTAAVFVLHSPERLATRLSTEGSQAWYGVRYEVPRTLELETGATRQVEVALTNTGRLTWDSSREPGFALAYHWLRSGSDEVVHFEGQRTPFARPVTPGERVAMRAAVTAPGEPGQYTLVWDVVHETRAWLSTEGVTPARSAARVTGAPRAVVATVMPRLPAAAVRPSRPQLWSAALAAAWDRPWLGTGPDNFRLVYGRYTGIDRPDPRVHANNMYLDVLAGAGVIGLAALAWLFVTIARSLVQRTLATGGAVYASAAFLAAAVMVAGHGLVDSFLSFTTTYLTFAIGVGLAFARAWTSDVAPVASASPRMHTGELGRDLAEAASGREGGPDHAYRV